MSRVQELLLDTARRGRLHHCLILHGPFSDQLRNLGVRLAMALNCPEGNGPDDCSSCGKIARGTHPDVHHVAIEEDRKLISVDQIRRMLAEATLRPYEGRTKVFLVESADTISPAGANAMLKTLEEPARDTVFLLLTRSADLLLPTIRSRSQSIAIHHAFERTVRDEAGAAGSVQAARIRREALALPSLDPADAERIARRLLAALAAFAEHRDFGALLGAASTLTAETEPPAALALLAILLRDAAAIDPRDSIDPTSLSTIRQHLPPQDLLRAASVSVRNATRLQVNADSRLLLEQALVTLATR
ncbi:MAG TPA: hypothetical protein VMS56_12375 [Thermoanaerobaculia bacterium]|nr:hypothetical protein [Thermoanaerobaculia bacterium]